MQKTLSQKNLNQVSIEIPIEIKPELITEQALSNIIENFILREGTDYGVNEASYASKAEQIRRQISKGDIKIIFDKSTETVTLLTSRDFQKLLSTHPASSLSDTEI